MIYRGFRIEPVAGTQLGYRIPGPGGGRPGRGRKINVVYIYSPEDDDRPVKTADTIAKAKSWIDEYLRPAGASESHRIRETRRASDDDLEDALDHMSDFSDHELSLNDFDIEHRVVQLEALDEYDDLSSWAEWDEGELAELDERDRLSEMRSFRGSGWARNAIEWTPRTVPSIVIVTLLDGTTAIADGRGRTSYAIGMGWPSIPATFLTEK